MGNYRVEYFNIFLALVVVGNEGRRMFLFCNGNRYVNTYTCICNYVINDKKRGNRYVLMFLIRNGRINILLCS